MIQVLVLFAFVFGTGFLLLLGGLVSALEKLAKAEGALAEAHSRHSTSMEKLALEANLVRQYYAHAVEKQWDAVR